MCSGLTGHFEAVEIVYDPSKVSFETLVRHFFEIHDPTDKEGQGPDRGKQYLSAIFFLTQEQNLIASSCKEELKKKGYDIVTQILPASRFYKAEAYHQHYYERSGKEPYCHRYTKRF